MDHTEIQVPPPDAPGVDRRTLIKRAAIAGAAAWTAPILVGSVTSPAGALTCANTCFQFQIDGDCIPATTEAFAGTCPIPVPPGSCPTVTTVGAGATFASVCFTATDCDGPGVTFTLTATGACWTQDTCAANRRFLGARAQLTSGTCLLPSAISDTTVSFTRPTGPPYDFFAFLVGCACT